MANEETSRTAEVGNGSIDPSATTPHRPDLAPFPVQVSPDTIGFWPQIRSHLDSVSKLVPIAWSLFLFTGGLIFLIYFFSIGFVPELDVDALVTLLAVSAVTGIALFLLIALRLFVPGWIWAHMIRTCDPLKQLWSADDGKAVSKLFQWLDLPMCGVILGILGGLFLVVNNVEFYGLGTWGSFWASFLAGLLISGGISGACLRRKLRCRFNKKQRRNATIHFFSSFLSNSWLFFLIIVGLVAPLLGRSYFVKPSILGSESETVTLMLLTIAAFTPVMIASEIALKLSGIKDDRPYSWFSLLQIIIYFSVLLSVPTFIADSVMSIYKFGLLNNASLVLDEMGCNIIQHYQLEPRSAAGSHKGCFLSNVVIHSRLGTAYYLEMNSDGKSPVRFTIPTQHVLSWATHQARKPTTAQTPQSHKDSPSTAGTTQPKGY